MKKEKSCGCIVFNDKLEVLLVKMNQGHWSFPKGHVEVGEDEHQTAVRETKEETNIDCEILDGFREINTYSPYPSIIKDVIFFVAIPKNNDFRRQEEEIAKVDFFPYEEALKLVTFKTDKDIFIKAYNFFLKLKNIKN